MAACSTPSSFPTLTYSASAVQTQDLTPSILSFKSNTLTFSLCPLVLNTSRHRKSLLDWCIPCPQRDSNHVMAAMADTATASPPKLKKGIAVFPLKMDRIRSKRFLEIQKLRKTEKEYDVKTAISLLKEMAASKFVETAEVHFRINIDPSDSTIALGQENSKSQLL
ncbi:50S ribosomal protein L1, chloroplastic-like [Hibiscus syriacus]|uniref:50S ribosomal protein L1, chloroplastic-like n=1 Tax=Hibiscus syriacus TaxID=106335 RepID=UPI001921D72A|nr:50S ribosomal protein L1, chloroplastic-like [Hibiscus syriacus]